jgi:hypothetical protein
MIEGSQYDVFLPHNSADKPAVETLARRLEVGLTSGLIPGTSPPSEPWQEAIEQ